MSRQHALTAAFGLGLGYSLTRIGFWDFGEVNRMFRLVDLRLLFTFAGAVALCMAGFLALDGWRQTPRPIHRGTVAGGVLFGVGWALTGACPAGALVQIGSGYLPALLTLGGILLGTWAYRRVHARFFRWDVGSCDS